MFMHCSAWLFTVANGHDGAWQTWDHHMSMRINNLNVVGRMGKPSPLCLAELTVIDGN